MRMRDAQLIRRIQAGDRTAADTLIEQYYTAILRYCARHTPCTQTAEDLTQEVFLHLFRTIGSYREQGQFRAYLYRIAYFLGDASFAPNTLHCKNFHSQIVS